jgi:hypothetical protein
MSMVLPELALPIVITSVADPAPDELMALIVAELVPAAVGVPEISPEPPLTLNPDGNPVALKLVGLLLAVIW